VTTIAFPNDPTYSFHQEGLLLRANAGGAQRVVQHGNVDGAGTDGWGDPALYAAEYDVSVWPPRQTQAPTRISDADEGAGPLFELPQGQLFFTWLLQVDNGGLGPYSILFRTANAESWELGAQGTLVKHASTPTAPTLSPSGDGVSLAYVYQDTGDAGDSVPLPPLVGLAGRLGTYAPDGTPRGTPAAAWSASTIPAMTPFWYDPRQALAETRTKTLLAIAFDTCGPDLATAFCEERSIVILRAGDTLERVASVRVQNADYGALVPRLLSDQRGHNWLTWWEGAPSDAGPTAAQNLFAVPLTDDGAPAGPVEVWFADDHVDRWSLGSAAPALGPLGSIYPVATDVTTDSGTLREAHLVHRQLDAVLPMEELTFTTPYTGYPIVAVQIAEPRTMIVGYSTYGEGTAAQGYAKLARYTCAEDAR
jgi:hypothetical protein